LRMASTENQATGPRPVPETFTIELTVGEMAFLRLILTNATVQLMAPMIPGTYEIRFLIDDSYRSTAVSANFKVVKP